jgi:hypothetical protein
MRPLKNVLVLIVFCLCFSASAFAARKIEGYYVQSPGGEKIKTTFLVPFRFLSSNPNYELMQSEIRFIDANEKRSLSPRDAYEVSFTYNGLTVLMRSIHNDLSSDQMFLNVVIDGPVSLYNYYESYYTPGHYSPTPGTGMATGGGKQTTMRLVLQRDNGELFKVRRMFFRNDLLKFFSDCSALFEKINSSSVSDLSSIVKEYNLKCL